MRKRPHTPWTRPTTPRSAAAGCRPDLPRCELRVEQQAKLFLLALQPLDHCPVQRVLAHRPRAQRLAPDGRLHAQRRARLDRLLGLGRVGRRGGGLVVTARRAEGQHRSQLGRLALTLRGCGGGGGRVLGVVQLLGTARRRGRHVFLERDRSADASHLGNQVAQRVVGHDVLVQQRRIRAGRGVPRQQPLRDGCALIRVAIGAHHRVLHDVLRDRADACWA